MKNVNFRWARRMPVQAALLLCAATAAVSARAGVTDDWNATTTNVVLAKGAPAAAYLAYVHAAMYDATNSIDGRFKPYAVVPTSPTWGASEDAAAAAAAYYLLLTQFPDQKPTLDAALAES